MKKNHYIAIACLLIVFGLAVFYLYRSPSMEKEEDISIDVQDETVETKQDVPVPHTVGDGVMESHQEVRILTEEDMRIWRMEGGRLKQHWLTLTSEYNHWYWRKYDGWTEEKIWQRLQDLHDSAAYKTEEGLKEIDELKAAAGALWRKELLLPPPVRDLDKLDGAAIRKEIEEYEFAMAPSWAPDLRLQNGTQAIRNINEEMQIIPHYFVDVRDGEVRLPPNTSECGALMEVLFALMEQPDPTDEDKKKIRQIAWEIYDMVKTNTPTSIFQMPERKEEEDNSTN